MNHALLLIREHFQMKSEHQKRYKIAFQMVRTNASISTSREKKKRNGRRTNSIVKKEE